MGIELVSKMAIMMSLLGVMLLIPILPSSAQPICWVAINQNCPQNITATTTCCLVITTQINSRLDCFCSFNSTAAIKLHNKLLSDCSFNSFESTCGMPIVNSTSITNATEPAPPADLGDQPPVPSPTGSVKPSHSASKNVIIGSAVGATAAGLLSIGIGIKLFFKFSPRFNLQIGGGSNVENGGNSNDENSDNGGRSNKNSENQVVPNKGKQNGHTLATQCKKYELEELKKATDNFSEACRLGVGGFGDVYKGTLANKQQIAVKRRSKGSGQGEKEFLAEVELSNLRHTNVVSLLGYCSSDGEMLLVYEFLANKSLDKFLFDSGGVPLDWSQRYNIIQGIARGILYLHRDSPTKIYHRDLKADNILLDDKLNPKIADFGLARKSELEGTPMQTRIIIGTPAYMSPESMSGTISAMTDVYSFGALVIEILSGRRINSIVTNQEFGTEETHLSYILDCCKKKSLKFMDPALKGEYIEGEAIKCIELGLLSMHSNDKKRPTMAKIVNTLDSDSNGDLSSIPQQAEFVSGVQL